VIKPQSSRYLTSSVCLSREHANEEVQCLSEPFTQRQVTPAAYPICLY